MKITRYKTIILLLFLTVFQTFTQEYSYAPISPQKEYLPFSLPELKLKDISDQRLWIGDNTIKDSTNYFVFNQGGLFWDSLRVRRDLYVGELGGTIYLDTNKTGSISYTGYGLYLNNEKENGSIYFNIGELNSKFYWYKSSGGAGLPIMQLDTITGLTVTNGNIQLTGGTQQIRFPSDTASDYDANDSMTVNRQSGKLTTKTITPIAGDDQYVWLFNSLITTSSKVFTEIDDNGSGTGTPIIRQVKTYSGVALIVIYNAHASEAINGILKINFFVIN